MLNRIEQLEKKFDDLAASVDRRFDAVDVAFAEHRQYTEFAFSSLDVKMNARFDEVGARFNNVDVRFDRLERTLDDFIRVQSKANELVERRLSSLEQERPG